MLRRCLLLLVSFALQAQIWQDQPQIWQDKDTIITFQKAFGSSPPIACFERSKGQNRLELPQALDDIYTRSWDHVDGNTYVFGHPHHPMYDWLKWTKPPQPQITLPLDLYRSRDFKTWERVGRWVRDQHGQPTELRPLRDGSFLAIGSLFWMGDQISPFARYRLERDGMLRFVELIDPGFGEPLYHPDRYASSSEEGRKWGRYAKASSRFSEVKNEAWTFLRTPYALVAIHFHSGWTLLMDPQDGHVLARLHPYPGADLHSQNISWTRLILGAQPAPDGTVLIAARQSEILRHGSDLDKSFFLQEDRRQTSSCRQAYELLERIETRRIFKETGAYSEYKTIWSGIRWFRLDPQSQKLDLIPAPPGAMDRVRNSLDFYSFRFQVTPDGSVTTFTKP